ncbi:MAG: hypothetical protein ABSB50_08655 [Terracidiphilus sp.]
MIVYRDKPGSPQPVVVPRDTLVEIVVKNRQPLETITFLQTTDALPPSDIGLAIVKGFLPVLSGIVGHVQTKASPTEQDKLTRTLAEAQQQLNVLSDEIACLKKGKSFDEATRDQNRELHPEAEHCIGALKDNDAVDKSRRQIVAESDPAKLIKLPVSSIKALDLEIAGHFSACWSNTTLSADDLSQCLTDSTRYEKDQIEIDDALAKLQARQAAMITVHAALASVPDAGDFIDDIQPSPGRKASVKITAKDSLGTTSVELGSVVISWQGSNFSVSTGILFSSLKNKTFANTPIIVNGVPVLDPSGKVTTQVTESDTVPSIVAPLIFLNYELPFIHPCLAKCGFLLSGGMGSNLTAKTADYAAGFSIRYRDILFTPAVHIGRINELTNGVVVGQKLGSSPPALPTAMHFTPKFGFAITYRLPFP